MNGLNNIYWKKGTQVNVLWNIECYGVVYFNVLRLLRQNIYNSRG